MTAEGNIYTQIQKDKDLEIKYTREFTDNEIKVVCLEKCFHLFNFLSFIFFLIHRLLLPMEFLAFVSIAAFNFN